MRVGRGDPQRSCYNKKRYASKGLARTVISEIRSGRLKYTGTAAGKLRMYRCSHCKGIHIGHANG